MSSIKKIYRVVSKIPKGKVSTYKQIAKLVPVKNPRLVGYYLHKNSSPYLIPCHRVIRSDGSIASGYAFGGRKKQIELLENEGIKLSKFNKINLRKYSFNFQLLILTFYFFNISVQLYF